LLAGRTLYIALMKTFLSSFNRLYTPRRRVALMHLIWLVCELRQAVEVGTKQGF
jgi:hypothetical protein